MNHYNLRELIKFALSYNIQIGSKLSRFIPTDSGDGAMGRKVARDSRGNAVVVSGGGGGQALAAATSEHIRKSRYPSRKWVGVVEGCVA